jgi:adenosylhomocysteine nucleosidase
VSRLGIVAALPGEARPLTGRRVDPGGRWRSASGVDLQLAGIGPRRAATAAEALLAAGATALASWGSAGALVPDLTAGALLLPRTVVAADGEVLTVDAAWHRRLLECLATHVPVATGLLVEVRAVVASPADKVSLRRRTGAVAVDMESVAIARCACQAGVPFVAVRAVVDGANTAVPGVALAALDGLGRLRPLRLAAGLLRAPRAWPALGELRRSFRHCQATLARVAALAGTDLLAP